MPVSESLRQVGLALLSLCGLFGLIALLSPRHFEVLARKSSRWIDSRRIVEVLDRRIDVDDYVLPHSRLLGALVLAAVSVLTFVCLGR
jgi:hypothetical protein